MFTFKLKANAPEFTVTDGPMAGRTFRRGRVYATIPPNKAKWFDQIAPQAPAAPAQAQAAPFGPAEQPAPEVK